MWKHLAMTVVVMLLSIGTPAFAAATAAGTGQKAPTGSRWIAFVIALVLLIGIAVASFMNAKRSHQD